MQKCSRHLRGVTRVGNRVNCWKAKFTKVNMLISNQFVGIPITVPRKAQRLTSEDGTPIISTRVPDSYY